MLSAVLIATCLAVAMPCFAQQVRVINGDFEHVYGPGGELLDNADLQARNQRAREHQAEVEARLRRQEAPTLLLSSDGGVLSPLWPNSVTVPLVY